MRLFILYTISLSLISCQGEGAKDRKINDEVRSHYVEQLTSSTWCTDIAKDKNKYYFNKYIFLKNFDFQEVYSKAQNSNSYKNSASESVSNGDWEIDDFGFLKLNRFQNVQAYKIESINDIYKSPGRAILKFKEVSIVLFQCD